MDLLAYFMFTLDFSGDDLAVVARDAAVAAAAQRFAAANELDFVAGDTVTAFRSAELQVPLGRAPGILVQLCSAQITPSVVVVSREDLDDEAASQAAEALEAAASRCGIQFARD